MHNLFVILLDLCDYLLFYIKFCIFNFGHISLDIKNTFLAVIKSMILDFCFHGGHLGFRPALKEYHIFTMWNLRTICHQQDQKPSNPPLASMKTYKGKPSTYKSNRTQHTQIQSNTTTTSSDRIHTNPIQYYKHYSREAKGGADLRRVWRWPAHQFELQVSAVVVRIIIIRGSPYSIFINKK